MKAMLPSIPEVGREVLILLAGAVVAAALVRALPEKYRDYFIMPTTAKN